MKKEIVCPVVETTKLLSDTWTMLIMHYIIPAPIRFCELERKLDGISTRTLTLKLNALISDKLIAKNNSGYYSATEKGNGLKIIERAMRKYGMLYLQ